MVLCTYNGAAFLEAQLQSILAQTYPLHEIVVVDDGSTDTTLAILEAFAAQHPLLRCYRNEQNLGYNRNFEKALSLATGEVLAISDQDDIWHPQKIEILLRNWTSGAAIYSDSVLFTGEVPAVPRPGRWMNRLQGTDPRQLALYNTVSGHALMLRRELLQLVLPFNPAVYYDWWLAVVAMANGGVIYHPEILVYQRAHRNNASLQAAPTKAQEFIRERNEILRNLEQFRKAPNLSAEQQHFFDTLSFLWKEGMEGRRKKELFLFLVRHRNVIYRSKKRKLPLISQLKRSMQYAFR